MTSHDQPAPPDQPTPRRRVLNAAMGFQQAVAAHRARRWAAAERLYSAVLDLEPGHLDALRYRGAVLNELKRFADAEMSLRTYLASGPDQAEARSDLGVALAGLGRTEPAIGEYQRALALAPNHIEALNNLGNALDLLGRRAEAIGCFERALAVRPDVAEVLTNLANVLLREDRRPEALERYQAAIALRPDYADARLGAAKALTVLDRRDEAIAQLEAAVAINPDDAGPLNALATALSAAGRRDEAVVWFERALALQPDFAQAHNNFGNTLSQLHRHAAALEHYETAIARDPVLLEAYCGRGQALSSLNRPTEALAQFDAVLADHPDFAEAHAGRGSALQVIGRLDESRAAYERAVALGPDVAALHLGLANAKTFEPGDEQLRVMEEMALGIEAMEEQKRLRLHFALGKALDDVGRHPEAFRHLIAGNALKRKEIEYREGPTHAMFRRVEQVFTPELIGRAASLGHPSRRPVFIVGMPRSGTTLVEQVLSSHPSVFGAGELPNIHHTARDMRWPAGGFAFPDIVPSLDRDRVQAMAEAYLASIGAMNADAPRVTDKMPENFLFVGLIHLLFPHARIIRLRRHPLDICISCFSKDFGDSQPHTYDLAELGRYHRAFERLMDHWRRVLPPGVMLEVEYERLVADFEPGARAIVGHCGLPWDPRCLEFYLNERPVRTASNTQVRRPIYSSSVARWKRYGDLLAPLVDSLGDDWRGGQSG